MTPILMVKSVKSPTLVPIDLPSLRARRFHGTLHVEVGFEVTALRGNAQLTVAASRRSNELRLFQRAPGSLEVCPIWGVPKSRGIPSWMVYNGKFYLNGWWLGLHPFLETSIWWWMGMRCTHRCPVSMVNNPRLQIYSKWYTLSENFMSIYDACDGIHRRILYIYVYIYICIHMYTYKHIYIYNVYIYIYICVCVCTHVFENTVFTCAYRRIYTYIHVHEFIVHANWVHIIEIDMPA